MKMEPFSQLLITQGTLKDVHKSEIQSTNSLKSCMPEHHVVTALEHRDHGDTALLALKIITPCPFLVYQPFR